MRPGYREELLAPATFNALIEPNQLNSAERKRRAGRCGRASRPDEPE